MIQSKFDWHSSHNPRSVLKKKMIHNSVDVLFVAKNHYKFHEAWQHEEGPSTPKTSLLECLDSRCYKQTDTTNANVWGYKDYTINFLKKGFARQGEKELICSKCVAHTFVFKWNLVAMPTKLVSLDKMPLFYKQTPGHESHPFSIVFQKTWHDTKWKPLLKHIWTSH